MKEHGTTPRKEAIAGATTFFSMAYILIVVPSIVSQSGMEWGAVFIATLISAIVGTLIMAFVANVPFAQAPGIGMASFFTFAVCGTMGFTWQQAMAMVFICGMVNILITVTKVRRVIISAIPESLQYAIAGGIGLFIAYVGLIQVGLIEFGSVPEMANFDDLGLILFAAGLVLVTVLHLRKVRGSMIITMIAISIIAGLLGLTSLDSSVSITEAFAQLPETFGVIFTSEGLPSLFSDLNVIPMVLVTIMSFTLVDTFDTIGTFIGTGRRSELFSNEELSTVGEGGFRTRLDRALLADASATSVGAIVGTTNTTTVVESMTGVEAGGRTGLTSLVTAILLACCMLAAPAISLIPAAATSAILVFVGIMMLSSFKDVRWDDLSEIIPVFFASFFMAICYNISYGIAMAFIAYLVVRCAKGEWRTVHPMIWVVSALFIIDFVMLAMI